MVEKLNEYAFNNNIQPVIECLNVLLENKQQYQTNLDLIFIAIASTQMYGFLSYLTDDEQQLFFECDYFRSNSYTSFYKSNLQIQFDIRQYRTEK